MKVYCWNCRHQVSRERKPIPYINNCPGWDYFCFKDDKFDDCKRYNSEGECKYFNQQEYDERD